LPDHLLHRAASRSAAIILHALYHAEAGHQLMTACMAKLCCSEIVY
jgi:hypothetical protein